MKFLKTAVLLAAVSFAFAPTHTFAEEPTPTSDLRKSADDAANAGKSEGASNDEKAVVEKVAETVAGGGETLPSADNDIKDGVDNVSEASEAVSVMVKAFNDKNWFLFTGCLLMLLIFGLRYFKVTDKFGIKGGGLLAFSISLGVIGSVAVELTLVGGAFTWGKLFGAIGVGVMEGLIACGAWEAAKGKLKGLTEDGEKASA